MKHRDLFSKEWCDMVFERRNKAYGAYLLRSQTGRRYAWAVFSLFPLVAMAVLPVIVFYVLHRPQKIQFDGEIKKIVRFDGVRIKEARAAERMPVRRTKSDPLAEKPAPPAPERVEQQEMQEGDFSEDLVPLLESVREQLRDSVQAQQEAQLAPPRPLQQTEGVVLDSVPRHPDGLAGFMKWLHQTMVYPPSCLRRKDAGHVVAAFIVEPSGKVSDIRILQGASRELNNEVLRVLYLMPNWIPAHRSGQPVRAQVTLPIEFQLSEEPYS